MNYFTKTHRLLVRAKFALLSVSFALVSSLAVGQETKVFQPPVEMTAQQDHQRMMELLHIASLRPGRDGMNPKAANFANYDETTANPFPNLPDPLTMKNGRRVTNARMWRTQRRREIVEDFDNEIYGRVPKYTPKVTWTLISTTHVTVGDSAVITRRLVGKADNHTYPLINVEMQMSVTTPDNATGRVPIILEFGFLPMHPQPVNAPTLPVRAGFVSESGTSWQQQLISKGWGYATLSANSIQSDNGAGLTKGIIGLCNAGQPRKPDDWGSLRAWAWGASRALDFFEKDKLVDAKQVGITGHSRYGKAALVTEAYDERFAIGFISSSGEGGAKLHRRNWGEIVENLASSGEYHWMAGNFLKYSGPLNWNDLPVDAHELIALCAPRPVYISSGAQNGDGWVDAKGMFLASVAAGPVYKLLGKNGVGATEFPPIETTLIQGDVAFRQHSGGHTPGPNWLTFIQFAERYLKPTAFSKF